MWKQERDCNPIYERSTGLQLYVGGPTGLGSVDISGFAAKYISLHAGIGINFSGFDMGVAFHLPMRSRHVTLYGGTDLSYVDRNGVIFLPVGGRYIFCNGISVGMEVLPGADTDGEYILWGSFKIGYFFHRKY